MEGDYVRLPYLPRDLGTLALPYGRGRLSRVRARGYPTAVRWNDNDCRGASFNFRPSLQPAGRSKSTNGEEEELAQEYSDTPTTAAVYTARMYVHSNAWLPHENVLVDE